MRQHREVLSFASIPRGEPSPATAGIKANGRDCLSESGRSRGGRSRKSAMNETKTPLSSGLSPVFSSMGLALGRVTGSVVGRSQELTAIEQELKSPRGGLVCLTAEGEPGIGKTRLLRAIEEMARGLGFLPIAVTADEEIRGPFLVARSIFASPNAIEAAQGTGAEGALQRALDALSNQDDPGLDGMAPNQKLL